MLRNIVLAALALVAVSSTAHAGTNADVLRICTGSPSGNYTFAAQELQKRLGGSFKEIQIVTTNGSLDNLRKLSADECDMAFAQSDVTDLYRMENPASLSTLDTFKNVYTEYVHLLCPVASGWTRVVDIGKNNGKIIVGPDGSGSAETWRSLRRADDKLYAKVERIADPVNIQAASKVKDSKDTCMLWVSGINSPDMQAANLMSVNTRDRKPALVLIDVDDRDMKSVKGSDGKPMYRFEKIERVEPSTTTKGVYPNLIVSGWTSSNVTVPTVDALLVTRKDYQQAIAPKASRIILAIEDAAPTIWKRVNPQQQ